ncbi:MAG: type II secretion system protein [Phycisphaerales bacterium]|nr:type II secretion system protein [Phycisphaerales bacterium]
MAHTVLHPGRRQSAFTLIELLVCIAIVALLLGLILPTLAAARGAGHVSVCASNLRQLQIANLMYAQESRGGYAPGAPDFLSNLVRWHGSRESASAAFTPGGGTLTEYISGGDAEGGGASGAVRACPGFSPPRDGFERSAGGYGYNNAFVGTVRGPVVGGMLVPPVAPPGPPGSELLVVVTDRVGSREDRFAAPNATVAFTDSALAAGSASSTAGGAIEYSFAEPRFWPDAAGARLDPSVHFRHGGKRDGRAGVVWLDGHVGSEARTFTWSSGLYGADPEPLRIGWFGAADDNSLFDYE